MARSSGWWATVCPWLAMASTSSGARPATRHTASAASAKRSPSSTSSAASSRSASPGAARPAARRWMRSCSAPGKGSAWKATRRKGRVSAASGHSTSAASTPSAEVPDMSPTTRTGPEGSGARARDAAAAREREPGRPPRTGGPPRVDTCGRSPNTPSAPGPAPARGQLGGPGDERFLPHPGRAHLRGRGDRGRVVPARAPPEELLGDRAPRRGRRLLRARAHLLGRLHDRDDPGGARRGPRAALARRGIRLRARRLRLSSRLRIALLTYRGNMFCGGQGIYAAHLAREWHRMGHEVHVIAGPPLPALEPGIPLHEVPNENVFGLKHPEWARRENPFGLLWPVNLWELGVSRFGVFPEMHTFGLRLLLA